MNPLFRRRLRALCRKEFFLIVRDPGSVLVAFILPVLLLFIFGYAINLDTGNVRLGVLVEDAGPAGESLLQALKGSSAFQLRHCGSRQEVMALLASGEVRGAVIVANDFSAKWLQGEGTAALQLLTDGSEPNTAQFIGSYAQGVYEKWDQGEAYDRGLVWAPVVELRPRSWFNPGMVSRNFLAPGSISVVMTIIGALLTSLVVAREWERGTMEALLATPVTRMELLLSKIIPYYLLGILAMILCLVVAVQVMGVPFRGSFPALFVISSLFLGSSLGLGLFLSTLLKNQFNAAQAALTAGFLPSLMLSGFVFQIESMPRPLQWLTRLVPARYFAHSLQTLFLAGTIPSLLIPDGLFLALLAGFWLGLTAWRSKRTVE